MRVEAGQMSPDPSRTYINPHELYKAGNNIEKVQNFLTNELHAASTSLKACAAST